MRNSSKSPALKVCIATWVAASFALWATHAMAQTSPVEPVQGGSQNASTPQIATISADRSPAMLDSGFHRLYGLDFQGARQEFLAYQEARPDDPLGKAAEASSYLFEEFNTKGVLSSDFS